MLRGWEKVRKTRKKFCFDCCVICVQEHTHHRLWSRLAQNTKSQWPEGLEPGASSVQKLFRTNMKPLADSPEIWLKPWELVKKLPAFPLLTHPFSLSFFPSFPPVIELNTTAHLPSSQLSQHLSFILRVSCQSPCLHAPLDKSKTPSRLRVGVLVCFLKGLCFPVCGGGRQKVTASNGPDSEVGAQLVCMRPCARCMRACTRVRMCVSPRYDGDSWGGTGRCSTPFHPDALVTLWSCSLLSTSPSAQHKVAGGRRVGDFGRVKLVTHTRGTATLPWVQTPKPRAMHVGILRSKNQL